MAEILLQYPEHFSFSSIFSSIYQMWLSHSFLPLCEEGRAVFQKNRDWYCQWPVSTQEKMFTDRFA